MAKTVPPTHIQAGGPLHAAVMGLCTGVTGADWGPRYLSLGCFPAPPEQPGVCCATPVQSRGHRYGTEEYVQVELAEPHTVATTLDAVT